MNVESSDYEWRELIEYAQSCPWIAGKHVADMMKANIFTDWKSVFTAISDNKIVRFCTFLKTDFYPENIYSPWISSIYTDEVYRGKNQKKR